jgi:hypothetical protein
MPMPVRSPVLPARSRSQAEFELWHRYEARLQALQRLGHIGFLRRHRDEELAREA